jgi:hypothetical protein
LCHFGNRRARRFEHFRYFLGACDRALPRAITQVRTISIEDIFYQLEVEVSLSLQWLPRSMDEFDMTSRRTDRRGPNRHQRQPSDACDTPGHASNAAAVSIGHSFSAVKRSIKLRL